MSAPRLSPQAQRWRVVMFTFPIIGITSWMLYRRTVLGEKRRELPSQSEVEEHGKEKVVGLFTAGSKPDGGAPS
ncbi:uncharacterized protein BXZ73DRAFT_103380 [Epithele typhae]|uniref:uncharacterized protein n=1 Tax=Epithele typhae TaxID=378194 RepID=UPI0020087D16|nr:uncharacterized protein BXZ73DRAFT_103380 [Epithele typhae]KAH9925002.1 hypothetical protein BXZ73DRAFT_103380 [Epithele typhae]